MTETDLGDKIIVPGFVDLQCNGGGGVLLDGNTNIEGLGVILQAHADLGTHQLLPTLITNTEDATDRVLALGAHAARLGLPGFLGLHLEGPHLSLARKGAPDPSLRGLLPRRSDRQRASTLVSSVRNNDFS